MNKGDMNHFTLFRVINRIIIILNYINNN